jgi:hypothetical protein
VNPILHARAHPDQKNAEPQQLTLIPQFGWRNPYFRQSTIAKQDRQSFGIQLVRLIGQSHPPLGFNWITQFGPVTRAFHFVDHPTVIPACFHCNGRMGWQSSQELAVKLSIMPNAERRTGLPFFIHGDKHGKLLVRVASDKLFHFAAAPPFQGFCSKFTQNPAAALS